ncbi:MAG: ACT domain-containing protein, partial [Acidimicrobiales bacterium]
PRAASKIRQWFSRERREDAVDNGRDELTKAMRREGLPVQKVAQGNVLHEIAKSLNYVDLDALYAAVGENHVSGKAIAARVARTMREVDPTGAEDEVLPTTARQPRRPASRNRPKAGVHVEGLDDLMVRLSRCCTPVPGDEILGFVTRGRGVSIHRADCANAVSLASGQADRLIDVEWDQAHDGTFVATIEVKALDRGRLLRDVAASMSDHHVNILSATTHTGSDRVSKMRFEFELADPGHLDSLLSTLRGIDSVYEAYRVVPGQGG